MTEASGGNGLASAETAHAVAQAARSGAGGILAAIGATPLLRLAKVAEGRSLYAKAEFLNPGGSIKSRSALGMVEEAWQRGALRPGGTLIEVTSGNEGVSLAMVGAVMGFHVVVVMPDDLPPERRWIIEAYGGEVVQVPAQPTMAETFSLCRVRADELARQRPGAYLSRQFDNPANASTHERTTGRELLTQLPAGVQLHAFVAAVGTGGTLTGVGRALKVHFPQIEIIAVEPTTSAVLSGGPSGHHTQYGIGEGFVPSVLDRNLIDRVEVVTDEEAYAMARELTRREGLLVGVSSGTNVVAALRTLDRLGADAVVATVLPDSGERYLCDLHFRREVVGGPDA